MSCDIRIYNSLPTGPGAKQLYITAFVGAEGGRRAVQFTIGREYCSLSEQAVKDLIDVLLKRLEAQEGYTATGNEREDLEFKE